MGTDNMEVLPTMLEHKNTQVKKKDTAFTLFGNHTLKTTLPFSYLLFGRIFSPFSQTFVVQIAP